MTILKKTYRDNLFEVRLQIDLDQGGLRLDQFLQTYLESFSREMIKKKIKLNEIQIVNRPGIHKPSTILHANEEVIIHFYKSEYEDEYWNNCKLDLVLIPEIVYQDKSLIVISKPPFMSTHPAGRHVFNCATVYFEMLYNQTIHSLHRIDRETSGLLMLGRDPQMATEIMLAFEQDKVQKCYLFIAINKSHHHAGETFYANESLLSPDDNLKRVLVEVSANGKHAKTYFQILETFDKYLIGIASPFTGRQHQIRVHAKTHGMPLIGDKLYLGSYEMFQRFKDHKATEADHQMMEMPRHALHAISLKIPYQSKNQIFTTKIPLDFIHWLSKHPEVSIDKLEKKIDDALNNYYQLRNKA